MTQKKIQIGRLTEFFAASHKKILEKVKYLTWLNKE